jgi:hypothetical protein
MLATGWMGNLVSAHLALRGLQRGSSLHRRRIPPMLQQFLLQFILLLCGVKAVHGHELMAQLLQPVSEADASEVRVSPSSSQLPRAACWPGEPQRTTMIWEPDLSLGIQSQTSLPLQYQLFLG